MKQQEKSPLFGKYDFWKIDFSKTDIKTGEPCIKKCDEDFIQALRITPSKKLAIQYCYAFGRKPKIYYVDERYYTASDSPVWFPTINKKYGYIIREKTVEISVQEQLALIELVNSNSN